MQSRLYLFEDESERVHCASFMHGSVISLVCYSIYGSVTSIPLLWSKWDYQWFHLNVYRRRIVLTRKIVTAYSTKGAATNLKVGGQCIGMWGAVNIVETPKFEKRWGYMTPPPSSYGGVATATYPSNTHTHKHTVETHTDCTWLQTRPFHRASSSVCTVLILVFSTFTFPKE